MQACINDDNIDAEDCSCTGCEWLSCREMEPDECGVQGEWTNTLSRHFLYCGVTPYGKCKTEEICEENGRVS